MYLVAVFAESLEAKCQVENEDVVGAAPTGDAPTTCEWTTILLPTKVRLILVILRYFFQCHFGLGCYCLSPSSGVSVQAAIVRVTLVVFQCGTVSTTFLHWCSSVPFMHSPVSPGGKPVYTESTSGIPMAFQCTLDQPVHTGSGYGLFDMNRILSRLVIRTQY